MTVPELAARLKGWLAGSYRASIFEDGSGILAYALYREEEDIRIFILPLRLLCLFAAILFSLWLSQYLASAANSYPERHVYCRGDDQSGDARTSIHATSSALLVSDACH
jgi:hypothetical protein